MADLLWWAILTASVILIVREMGKWLRSRTKRVETWVDTPRLESPADEVEEVANQFKGYSDRDPNATLVTKQRILDTIKDRIGLKLNLRREELDRAVRDPMFLRQTFGGYPLILRYVSREWLNLEQPTGLTRKSSGGKESGDALLREIRDMLDSVERWEEDHEHSRSL